MLAAVVPVLATSAVGFIWVRSGRPLESATLTRLIADLGTPCLIVSTLMRTRVTPQAFGALALATATAVVGFALAGSAALLSSRLRLRTYLPSIAFPNTGNLGLPLSLYAFGQEGLGLAVVFFAMCSIANYTLGQAMAAGTANFKAMARAPILYATGLGVAASVWRLEPPPALANALSLVGGMTVPLMLLMLGASLGRLRVGALHRALFVTLLRIGLGTATGIAVAALYRLHGVSRSVLVLQCSMPVAVYNYLFAELWNNEPEEVAGLVVVSTIAAAVTVPLTLLYLTASP
jgi:predicted permease